MRTLTLFIPLHMLLFILLRCEAAAQEGTQTAIGPVIYPGAIMAGIGGSLTVVEGISHIAAAVRGGRFFEPPAGIGEAGMEASYTYLSGMHQLDLEGHLTWGFRIRGSSAYSFAGIAGGARMERIGSFSQMRYPLGIDLGVRALVAPDALIETAYRYRRITGDPIADYSEHRMVIGVTLLFGNVPPGSTP